MTTPMRFSFPDGLGGSASPAGDDRRPHRGRGYVTATASSEKRVAQMWVAATVVEDGSAEIVEVIDYDFGPRTTDTGSSGTSPTADLGGGDVCSPLRPTTSAGEILGSDPLLRIGDPDETVSGLHRYVLRYTLDDVAQNGQIAWDAVGTEWDVPIEDVEVHVVAAATLARLACRTGTSGSPTPAPSPTRTRETSSPPSVTSTRARGSPCPRTPASRWTPPRPCRTHRPRSGRASGHSPCRPRAARRPARRTRSQVADPADRPTPHAPAGTARPGARVRRSGSTRRTWRATPRRRRKCRAASRRRRAASCCPAS